MTRAHLSPAGTRREGQLRIATEIDIIRYHSNGANVVAQLLVRNVPPDVVAALKRRAAEHGRNAEAEHRLILEEVLRPGRAGFWERAAKLREQTKGRISVLSEELIRRDRDER